MANYQGANTWQDDIYNFETTDLLQGGSEGIDNIPIKQLTDRTKYLYERIGLITKMSGDVVLTSNTTLDNTIAGKLFTGDKTTGGVLDITLPLSSTLAANSIITFFAKELDGVVNIRRSGSDTINGESVMHMHNGESIVIISASGGYKVVSCVGNFWNVGEEVKGRKIINNTLPLKGQLINRDTKPRLWKYIQSLDSGLLINDATWNANIINKGFFSTGNGSTTFRLPDESGLFERMQDSERLPGSYQADRIGDFVAYMSVRNKKLPEDTLYYEMFAPVLETVQVGTTDRGIKNLGAVGQSGVYSVPHNAAPETNPKNIAKINLIKY